MKKTLIILAIGLALLVANQAKSQSVDILLTQTDSTFDSAKTYPQLLLASNQFKLIAKQNPQSWIANYYAAWSIAVLSFQTPQKDEKDPMLDEADGFFQKIQSMDSTNGEVATLGGLLAQARLSVAPASRHGKYGAIANTYFATAKKLNPHNPRIYYLEANSLFYTPKLFGGGAEKALPLYEKAESLFSNDSNDIEKPHWGKKVNETMMKQCKDKIGK
jgi:hypothetical protein